MTTQFWPLIERVAADAGSPCSSVLLPRLRRALRPLPRATRVGMAQQFHTAVWQLYSYRLWGCCTVLSGGEASDDFFVYWRNWLVLQGEALFLACRDDEQADAALAEYAVGVGLDLMTAAARAGCCNGERLGYAWTRGLDGIDTRFEFPEQPRGATWSGTDAWEVRLPRLLAVLG